MFVPKNETKKQKTTKKQKQQQQQQKSPLIFIEHFEDKL